MATRMRAPILVALLAGCLCTTPSWAEENGNGPSDEAVLRGRIERFHNLPLEQQEKIRENLRRFH